VETKRCSMCEQTKPLAEFRKDKTRRLGVASICKRCHGVVSERSRIKNKEKSDAARRRWRANNPLKVCAYARAALAKDYEKKLASNKRWQQAHPQKMCAYTSARRAAKLRSRPAWANKEAINRIYALRETAQRASGLALDVDHIVPLISPLVCGLHVESNLRIITAKKNRAKGNRHWPDMPEMQHAA
jgi:hypothetical protein